MKILTWYVYVYYIKVLVVPLGKKHAQLMQNYRPAPGPGKSGPRFWDVIPEDGYASMPSITTWVGTDTYGLEFSCESTRGWAMATPEEAFEIRPCEDRTIMTFHLISKPVCLSSETPRRIRFALVATPTKTVQPYLQQIRFYDDCYPYLLPMDWSGDPPVWHPPITDVDVLATMRDRIERDHKLGIKHLTNGGWSVSAQVDGWEIWGRELCVEPLRNVSFGQCRQYAHCYHSPFTEYLVNSFGVNARTLGFDGIRFDTVVPGYVCKSLVHDCGWYDDDGNLWGRNGIFAAREAWKRLYRIFHGGVIENGVIQTPNAAGPIMAVHSFSDHHEIGEGFYQKASDLKTAYPPGLVRSAMTGRQYGFRAEANIKSGPLFWNERVGALLANGAEPRFHDYRHWKPGYAAHASPAVNVWESWEWVDRWTAEFRGWWQNADLLQIANDGKTIVGSLWFQPGKKVLLVVTNYEREPVDDLALDLDLDRLGLTGPVFAEDTMLEAVDKVINPDAEAVKMIEVAEEQTQETIVEKKAEVEAVKKERRGTDVIL